MYLEGHGRATFEQQSVYTKCLMMMERSLRLGSEQPVLGLDRGAAAAPSSSDSWCRPNATPR